MAPRTGLEPAIPLIAGWLILKELKEEKGQRYELDIRKAVQN